MKNKDIEKAAEQNVEFQGSLDFGAIIENACRESFVLGAEWRIDSVWHDLNINTNKHDDVVLLLENGKIVDYNDNWEEYYSPVLKWAYKKDLLPNIK